ncbi:MAG: DUF2752 domain-containing protein [Myxococcota bacterium]
MTHALDRPKDRDELVPAEVRSRRHVVAAWVGFVAALYLFPGSGADGVVFCPFRRIFGYSCPGCGMTRSCIEAAHGNLLESVYMHPLGALFVAGCTVAAVASALELRRGRRLAALAHPGVKRVRDLGFLGVGLFVLVFGGARLALEIAGILTPV